MWLLFTEGTSVFAIFEKRWIKKKIVWMKFGNNEKCSKSKEESKDGPLK